MSEILLSFFAAVGIIFIFKCIAEIIIIKKTSFPSLFDLTGKNADETEKALEILSNVKKTYCGNLLLSDVTIILDNSEYKEDIKKIELYKSIKAKIILK